MWIEVKTSSRDDPLGDQDRVLEVVAVPRHERDEHVAAERELAELGRRAVGDDVALLRPVALPHQRTLVDAGVLVRALELGEPVDVDARLVGRDVSSVARTTMRFASTWSTMPGAWRAIAAPELRATTSSMPVPTIGASALSSGTAWRCMFEPISARFASSFSRNGISAAATETSCFGETSM